MQLLRSIAGQLFIVFFIHSFHNVKIQALPQSVLTASASTIGEEESVTLQCSARAGDPPKKCWFYLISPNGEKNLAFECQATFTGSVLLAENFALAEVKVRCYYTNDRGEPAPHSDIVSITVARALPQSLLTASASSIREEESVTLQCSAKAGHPPRKCLIFLIRPTQGQKNIAFECQETFTGSDLLRENWSLAEVKVGCFYTNDRWKPPTAPHSDILSITVRRVVTGSPTSVSQISPTPARPTSNRPTPARPTPASPTPASPTPARPTPARPTSASPQLASPITACTTTAATTVENPNSVVPGSPTSTSTTTAATTMVNSNSSAPYTPPGEPISGPSGPPINPRSNEEGTGRIFLKAAIILIVCCGVIVFLIVLLFAVLQTWRRRKKNTMEMKSLNTGSSKVVNRSGSGIKKDGDYHMYSTISNEPSAPNQTLVYDLLQAN
ncbi:transcription initiation factor TFIID subunit 12 isoform X5 [Gadus morhua]|uniref:transcription initiation factor TFIID subunit 12 isoform X5 n=1 Tax=Gadus morhua TaxID=8049 RepID=UPI0011B4B4C5|nr:transcription initiation factor TFIID subunit 12-like isoform X5 [Gadus morhua]